MTETIKAKMDIFAKLRSRRVIDVLREKFPEGTWSYDPVSAQWSTTEGWSVAAYARFSPQYDGDDDTFITEYRRTDNHELVRMW